jgi:hypothetical protein
VILIHSSVHSYHEPLLRKHLWRHLRRRNTIPLLYYIVSIDLKARTDPKDATEAAISEGTIFNPQCSGGTSDIKILNILIHHASQLLLRSRKRELDLPSGAVCTVCQWLLTSDGDDSVTIGSEIVFDGVHYRPVLMLATCVMTVTTELIGSKSLFIFGAVYFMASRR